MAFAPNVRFNKIDLTCVQMSQNVTSAVGLSTRPVSVTSACHHAVCVVLQQGPQFLPRHVRDRQRVPWAYTRQPTPLSLSISPSLWPADSRSADQEAAQNQKAYYRIQNRLSLVIDRSQFNSLHPYKQFILNTVTLDCHVAYVLQVAAFVQIFLPKFSVYL